MKIGIFGGDKRMLFAAKAFADDGHDVFVAGFDHLISLCDIRICSYADAAERCDIAILSVRPTADGSLNTPFSERKIGMSELTQRISDKPIFTGFADQVRPYAVGKVFDYSADESFTLKNAELTAEGAVGLLINDYEGAVCGTDILVTGYGRIGKILSAYLKAMGANVTVAARNPAVRESIGKNGLIPIDYPDVEYADYRVIINTVPVVVMGREAVDRMRGDVYLIELASVPGGFDVNRVRERDLSIVISRGLPGKTAPLAAGTIIKDTVVMLLTDYGIL
ncbi:MAG: hypothetical protein IJH40_07835 [Ruminococcus sp.]|uniref:dipicolinate synthase subunit DpsA n=1 Tax=Ruminococcus sp. TaxID=41978 RepID=UPI002872D65D|nr:dipicolinate synthase subunit DpsA [Ruminococcus sp.]MBQ3285534.1 hypothetical protein [Ruminococcus sp.]